ncbi:MAG: hypothetical protein GC185_06635 [Alphaproteobacteria bacterium]|nr:hypothetical protein [Alphaproteobacteria bacterium]
MANDFETKKVAASIAQVINDRLRSAPALAQAFKTAATPEQKAEYNRLSNVIFEASLGTAAAGSKKEKETVAASLFDAMIQRADLIAGMAVEAEPTMGESLTGFFTKVKDAPKYAEYDFGKAYEDAGATLLAKSYAAAPKSPKPGA